MSNPIKFKYSNADLHCVIDNTLDDCDGYIIHSFKGGYTAAWFTRKELCDLYNQIGAAIAELNAIKAIAQEQQGELSRSEERIAKEAA